MIKFIHKKHINNHPYTARIVIYYSFADIVLGTLLVILSTFFAVNYTNSNSCNQAYHQNQNYGLPTPKK